MHSFSSPACGGPSTLGADLCWALCSIVGLGATDLVPGELLCSVVHGAVESHVPKIHTLHLRPQAVGCAFNPPPRPPSISLLICKIRF